MRTAYSYIRMSSDKQIKGDSLRRQLDLSEMYARNNQLELVDSIDGISLTDIGISGFRGKNSQDGTLGIFLSALESGKIKPNSVLLIESLDRLSRDRLSDALQQFMSILQQGVEIITLTDNQKYTKEIIDTNQGSLIISLSIMFRANEESEIKSKRLAAVWENKRSNSNTKALTKLCPAWLMFNNDLKKFEVIEDRACVVRSIFDMCINTFGMYSIVRNLNENRVPLFGKGQFWNKSYITKILNNRAVIGEFQPHKLINGRREKAGEPITDYFPKIIDENTFLLAKVSIARRALINTGAKGANFTNIFSGLIFCGECGSKMLLRNRGGLDRSSKSLKCANQLVSAGCNMPEWNLADFELMIFRHLREVNFTDLINNNNSKNKPLISLDDQKSALVEKLKLKETELDRLINLMFESELSPTLLKRYQSKNSNLDVEINEIQNSIDDLSNQIINQMANETVFSAQALIEMINELKIRQDDYEFRSSVNNYLSRVINKFELIDSKEHFLPWELNDDDDVVQSYRKTFPIRLSKSLNEIINSSDFEQFYRRFFREIQIHYKAGSIRNIKYGSNMSFANPDHFKQSL